MSSIAQHLTNDAFQDRVIAGRPPVSIGFVSTYPPAMCGLATFTESLRDAMTANRGHVGGLDVVELIDALTGSPSGRPEVIARLDPADPWSVRLAAERLNEYEMVVLQHEYGIWGPDMGASVLEFLDRLDTRLITTLHTLLQDPSSIQERIIEALTQRSVFTIVPTQTASDLLTRRYAVDPRTVKVIPHGTDAPHRTVARLRDAVPSTGSAPKLLTWGLIGPGKGLEWSIRAAGLLKASYPDLHYTIAGSTHPKVLAHQGEQYRHSLERIVSELGLEDNVEFLDAYLPEEKLHELLSDARIVVLPYDSTEQMVSGVLVEAVSANVPVVATAFPHAVEMSEAGAASTVPSRNPTAIAKSISDLLDSQSAMDEMVRAQRRLSPDLGWTSVAADYEKLIEDAVRGSAVMSHVSSAS